MSYRNRSSGFTLIEMMIVVVLIGIAAAFAVPSFTQLVERNRVSSTVNGMLGILNYARSEAVKAGQTVDVTPLTGNDWNTGVVVWLDADNDDVRDAGEELRRFTDIPNGLTVAGAGGVNAIGFRGNGFLVPDTAAEFQLSVTSLNTPARFVCTGFPAAYEQLMQRVKERGSLMIKKSGQRGFTMIEVLIAMLIFAIGLLGVAGMQSLALKSSDNSNIRSLVNIHAYEIVERMRANMPAVKSGQYNSISGASTSSNCSPSCGPTQLAAWDASEWYANLQADVPSATGAVSYANGMATVTINWTERSLGNDAEAQTYSLQARIDQ